MEGREIKVISRRRRKTRRGGVAGKASALGNEETETAFFFYGNRVGSL